MFFLPYLILGIVILPDTFDFYYLIFTSQQFTDIVRSPPPRIYPLPFRGLYTLFLISTFPNFLYCCRFVKSISICNYWNCSRTCSCNFIRYFRNNCLLTTCFQFPICKLPRFRFSSKSLLIFFLIQSYRF